MFECQTPSRRVSVRPRHPHCQQSRRSMSQFITVPPSLLSPHLHCVPSRRSMLHCSLQSSAIKKIHATSQSHACLADSSSPTISRCCSNLPFSCAQITNLMARLHLLLLRRCSSAAQHATQQVWPSSPLSHSPHIRSVRFPWMNVHFITVFWYTHSHNASHRSRGVTAPPAARCIHQLHQARDRVPQ